MDTKFFEDSPGNLTESRAADTEPAPPPSSTRFPGPPKIPSDPIPPRLDPETVPTEPEASPEPFPLPSSIPPEGAPAEDAPPLAEPFKPLPIQQAVLNAIDPFRSLEGDPAETDISRLVYSDGRGSFSRDLRPWHDYGLDTGPRLRVKGLVDRPGPQPEPEEERREWLETHERYKRARAEGDDHTIGKLMAPLLDALHTETPPTPLPDIDWTELEPALLAELREWGRAHGVRPRHLAFKKFFGDNACVRVMLQGEVYEARIEPRAAQTAWKQNLANPRKTAARLVSRISAELSSARARETISVPDPERL